MCLNIAYTSTCNKAVLTTFNKGNPFLLCWTLSQVVRRDSLREQAIGSSEQIFGNSLFWGLTKKGNAPESQTHVNVLQGRCK